MNQEYIPIMKKTYLDTAHKQLMSEFNYSNELAVPNLDKIAVNMGLGEAVSNNKALESSINDITKIAGQKPVVTRAKQAISNFKIRQGNAIGLMVTLRGNRMWDFYDRLVNIALPRTRDFRGVSSNSFDGHGNYSLGIREHVIFPDIDIQSLDRLKLVKSLSKAEIKLNKRLNYMVQVNTGNEVQKSGINPNEVDDFIKLCKKDYGLNITGLMCIPPINQNPAIHFAFMLEIYKRNNLQYLSMGMSNDYKTAIEFGATHIRIGSKLFGERLEKEEI